LTISVRLGDDDTDDPEAAAVVVRDIFGAVEILLEGGVAHTAFEKVGQQWTALNS